MKIPVHVRHSMPPESHPQVQDAWRLLCSCVISARGKTSCWETYFVVRSKLTSLAKLFGEMEARNALLNRSLAMGQHAIVNVPFAS
jgi:hypothetical protein